MGELRGGSTVGGYPIESTKGSQQKVDSHAANSTHITAAERTAWNAKAGTAVATSSANGLMAAADKSKLDGVAAGANNYSLPVSTASVFGGVKTGTNITNSSGTISIANASTTVKGVVQLTEGVASTSTTTAATPNSVKTVNDSLTTHAGNTTLHITAAERTAWNAAQANAIAWAKTMGLGENLQARQTSNCDTAKTTGFYYVSSAASTRPSGTTDGSMIVLSYDSNLWVSQIYFDWRTSKQYIRSCNNNVWSVWTEVETTTGSQAKVNTHAGNTTLHITAAERTAWNAKAGTAVATTAANGLMAAADKTKLDGVAAGANNYSLPAATTAARGGVITGTNITNSSGTISVANASTTAKGVVQLNDNLTSTSTTEAATANAVRKAFDAAGQATSAVVAHGNDRTVHITAAERTAWNNSSLSIPKITPYALARIDTGVVNTTNWNLITTVGIHGVSSVSGTNGPPAPYAYGVLLVLRNAFNDAGVQQIYFPHTYSDMWMRSGFGVSDSSNTRWSAWQKSATTNEITSHAANTSHITAAERTKWNKAVTQTDIPDTRTVNPTPQWYWTNYPKCILTEFKTNSAIGISGGQGHVVMKTIVPWNDDSGGPIIQIVNHDSIEYRRHSTSVSNYSAWVKTTTQTDIDTKFKLSNNAFTTSTLPNGSIGFII